MWTVWTISGRIGEVKTYIIPISTISPPKILFPMHQQIFLPCRTFGRGWVTPLAVPSADRMVTVGREAISGDWWLCRWCRVSELSLESRRLESFKIIRKCVRAKRKFATVQTGLAWWWLSCAAQKNLTLGLPFISLCSINSWYQNGYKSNCPKRFYTLIFFSNVWVFFRQSSSTFNTYLLNWELEIWEVAHSQFLLGCNSQRAREQSWSLHRFFISHR